MNIQDFYDNKSTFFAWPEPKSLAKAKFTLMYNATQHPTLFMLPKALLNMKFSSISLVLKFFLQIRELKKAEEVFEKINTLICCIANLENWTNNLTLHLLIDQNYILFVVNHIANLGSNFPNLSSNFIDNILQYFFILHTIDFGEHYNYRHLERESYS